MRESERGRNRLLCVCVCVSFPPLSSDSFQFNSMLEWSKIPVIYSSLGKADRQATIEEGHIRKGGERRMKGCK